MTNIAARLFTIIAMLVSFGTFAADAGAPLRRIDPMDQLLAGLIDQNGRKVADGRFAGRYVLVNFIFTGCGTTCPTQTADLARFDRKLPQHIRDKVTILSISVDPGNDKPQKLKAYANTFGVDVKRWTFATGRPDRIMQVVRNFAAMRPGEAGLDFHTTEVRLFDTRHRMIQRYTGAPLAEKQLRADLTALIGGPA